jgi:hypothetical protein
VTKTQIENGAKAIYDSVRGLVMWEELRDGERHRQCCKPYYRGLFLAALASSLRATERASMIWIVKTSVGDYVGPFENVDAATAYRIEHNDSSVCELVTPAEYDA